MLTSGWSGGIAEQISAAALPKQPGAPRPVQLLSPSSKRLQWLWTVHVAALPAATSTRPRAPGTHTQLHQQDRAPRAEEEEEECSQPAALA